MNFEFFSVPRIIFGRGKVAELGPIATSFGKSALIVHNGSNVGSGGAVDKAADSLRAAGMRLDFYRQRGEPTITDVDAALDVAKSNASEVIIGLGGGSAIDCAKATAGLLANGGSALDYMEVIGQGRKITQPSAPWIAVPTTAGTGAEVTRNAVIGSPEHKYKASIRSEHLMAKVALIDPELGVDTPPAVTAASGMDALCQCVEAFTSTHSWPLTASHALNGFSLAFRSLKHAYHNGENIDARENMSAAALMSGIALTNAGLGAVHGMAAPLGACFPIPHGVACARLLPFVVAENIAASRKRPEHKKALLAYARFGQIVAKRVGMREGQAATALIQFLHEIVRLLRIPSLRAFGFQDEHIPEIVSLAKKSSSMKFNPVVLADDVLANILRSAL